jgi:HrpA-like RNA helicase
MCIEAGYHTQLTDHTIPDIQCGDMLSEVLQIVKLGRNPINFPYMCPPAPETVVRALGIYAELGTIKRVGTRLEITPHGENVLSLPVTVFCAEALLASARWKCTDEMISVISMIEASEGGTTLFKKQEKYDKDHEKAIKDVKSYFNQTHGDHIMLHNIYNSWRYACEDGVADVWLHEKLMVGATLKRADTLRSRLLRIMGTEKGRERYGWKESMEPTSSRYFVRILVALASGFHLQVAKRVPTAPKSPSKATNGSDEELYDTVRQGARAKLYQGQSFSPQSSDWVIYNEFSNKGPDKAYLSLVTPVPLELILEEHHEYWVNVESKTAGHIQDALIKRICELTELDESEIRVKMPPPPQQEQQ